MAPVRNRTVCSPTLILFLDFFLIDCSGVAMLQKLPVVLGVNVAFRWIGMMRPLFYLVFRS